MSSSRIRLGSQPEVRHQLEGGERRLECRLVIGADGRRSSVRAPDDPAAFVAAFRATGLHPPSRGARGLDAGRAVHQLSDDRRVERPGGRGRRRARGRCGGMERPHHRAGPVDLDAGRSCGRRRSDHWMFGLFSGAFFVQVVLLRVAPSCYVWPENWPEIHSHVVARRRERAQHGGGGAISRVSTPCNTSWITSRSRAVRSKAATTRGRSPAVAPPRW